MAEAVPVDGPKKYIYRVDLEALGERVEAAREAANWAERLFGEIRDADDWKQRFEDVVVAVEDWERGVLTDSELRGRVKRATEDVREELQSARQDLVDSQLESGGKK
jgi:hypothetical protein